MRDGDGKEGAIGSRSEVRYYAVSVSAIPTSIRIDDQRRR